MSFSSSSLKRLALLAATLVPVALITGCSMTGTAPATNSFSPAATISGSLHGGNQPITGAIVSLYVAGTTGYGSTGTLLATTTSNNDASASFSFSQLPVDPVNFPTGVHDSTQNVYSCPSTGGQQLYIFAKDGETVGSSTNSNAAFIAAIGSCSTATSSFVNLNEVTTVATLAALQQYFNPNSEALGYNSTAQSALGFANGVATIPTLVNVAVGSANTTFTPTSTLAGAVVTATPEFAKINTIADVLAACVNTVSNIITTSATCSTLFTNAVPPASSTVTSQPTLTFVTATDTVQAGYYMLINPTESQDNGSTGKMANLYGLQAAAGAPFQPALTVQPTDWTIGVSYSSTSKTTGTGTPYLFYQPTGLAVDASGNIWVENYDAATVNVQNSVTELSPTGGVENQVFAGLLAGPKTPIIDPSGNLWIPSYGSSGSGTSVLEYTAGGVTNTFTTSPGPEFLASDGQGNIFVSEPFFGSGLGDVQEIPAGSATTVTPTTIVSGLATDYSPIGIDSNYTIWLSGGGASPGANTVYQFLYSATAPNYPSTPNNSGSTLTTDAETPLFIDNGNNIFVENYSSTAPTFSELLASNTSTIAAATGSPFAVPAKTTSIKAGVVDGASNIWIVNASATAGVPNILEFSDAGFSLLSPATGYAHTYYYPEGIAIDPSGNVWVANEDGTGANSTAAKPVITEIIGSAVPVVTPIAAGLPTTPGPTSLLGAKP
jgi:hypothetical protein